MSSVLVVGGGITGMQAATSLARAGTEVFLAEREDRPGGNLKSLGATFGEGRPAPELIEQQVQAIASSSRITMLTMDGSKQTRRGMFAIGFNAPDKSGPRRHETARNSESFPAMPPYDESSRFPAS